MVAPEAGDATIVISDDERQDDALGEGVPLGSMFTVIFMVEARGEQ